ncbi:MAG: dienelactone hydrolase family protein, partial [Verrucomicrobiota bacterium]
MKRLCAVFIALSFSPWLEAEEAPWPILHAAPNAEPLPDTSLLDWKGDLAERMVEGVDQFLDAQIAAALSSAKASGSKSRDKLEQMLGLQLDSRPASNAFEYADWSPDPRAESPEFVVRQVRWKAFRNVHGMGLLIEPKDAVPIADIIALPDADHLPEDLCALPPYPLPQTTPFALNLARSGCRVLVPLLINREEHEFLMPNREWLHRPAYELGRTLAGYEVQKVLAAVDCLLTMPRTTSRKLGVVGWGEGGRLALYAAAVDSRIDGAVVSGYLAPRGEVWNEPADRTLFGLLHDHSDWQIASLIAPRTLIVEAAHYPDFVFRPDELGNPERLRKRAGKRGKPGRLISATPDQVRREFNNLDPWEGFQITTPEVAIADESWQALLRQFDLEPPLELEILESPEDVYDVAVASFPHTDFIAERHQSQLAEIEAHNQWALVDADRLRANLTSSLDVSDLSSYRQSAGQLRAQFSRDVIGEFDALSTLPVPNARSRSYQIGEKTISFEVVLEVGPEVFSYGILTLPKDLDLEGTVKYPVVVCQHGLEGRPQDVIGESKYKAYKAFATRLAERGYVTFAPQNIYIGFDHFRLLQFKANALGCTLFSIMIPQHRQITNWLAGLPSTLSPK